MGLCTSDPLGVLTNTYGDDVQKYFVSLKSEHYLDTILPQLSKKIDERYTRCSSKLNQQFDIKQKIIRQYFDRVLTKSLKESRTALEGIKKKENKNQEEIFGLTTIHNRFIKLRMNKDSKVEEHKQNFMNKLNKTQNTLKTQIIQNRPSLPIFQQMPFWLKSQIEADMTITYERQLEIQYQRLLNSLQKQVYLQNLEESLRKQSGMEEADNLATAAQAAFERIHKKLSYFHNPKSCFA